MNQENTDKLFNKYPVLYEGRYYGPSKSLMCFGFECGNGWFDIVDRLSKRVCELSPLTQAIQVKEKFGGLRFYVGSAPVEVFDAIDEAEVESTKVCEVCGSPGKTGGSNDYGAGSFLSTRCDGCREAGL